MNPGNSEQLPNPKFELPITPENDQAEENDKAVEKQPALEGAAGKRDPHFPPLSIPVNDPVTVTAQPVTDDPVTSQPPPASSDLTAEDADLIEKEWVSRAKAVVARTQDDPFIQKREISRVKADYIQKRFNKTIKTDEAVSS